MIKLVVNNKQIKRTESIIICHIQIRIYTADVARLDYYDNNIMYLLERFAQFFKIIQYLVSTSVYTRI